MSNSSTAKKVTQKIRESLYVRFGWAASARDITPLIRGPVEAALNEVAKISVPVSVTVTPVVEKPSLQEVFDIINRFTQTTRDTINVRVWNKALEQLQEDFKRVGLYDMIDWTKE